MFNLTNIHLCGKHIFFDSHYLPIGQKCFSLLAKVTQAKELKRKKNFWKPYLMRMEDHFVFLWVLLTKSSLQSQLLESGSRCKFIAL